MFQQQSLIQVVILTHQLSFAATRGSFILTLHAMQACSTTSLEYFRFAFCKSSFNALFSFFKLQISLKSGFFELGVKCEAENGESFGGGGILLTE